MFVTKMSSSFKGARLSHFYVDLVPILRWPAGSFMCITQKSNKNPIPTSQKFVRATTRREKIAAESKSFITMPKAEESSSSISSPPLMSPQSQNKQLEETAEGPLFTDGVSAYRAHFSCQFTGKVKAKSKRKITWYVPLLLGESLFDPVSVFAALCVP